MVGICVRGKKMYRLKRDFSSKVIFSEKGAFRVASSILSCTQCCGSASIIMRIRIQDPKNVHIDPDADPDPRG